MQQCQATELKLNNMDIPVRHEGIGSYVSASGVASLGIGLALYAYSLHTGRKSYDLEKAYDVLKLEDLRHLVHVFPALVAIRGRVTSPSARKCELCDKSAVIHEVVEEEIWRKQRAEGRTVYEPFETRKVFEECEWFLEDGHGLRVKVENAMQADRLRSAMEVKTEFQAEDLSQKTLGKVLMEKAWQMTKHGMRKTERYLPVGTVVTCVGELDHNYIRGSAATGSSGSNGSNSGGSSSKSSTAAAALPAAPAGHNTDNMAGNGHVTPAHGSVDSLGLGDGVGQQGWSLGRIAGTITHGLSKVGQGSHVDEHAPFVLRKPADQPSYITPLTLEQLKTSMSSTARNCRWLAYAFGAVGAALLIRKAVMCWLQRMHERRIRQRVAQAEAARKARLAAARKTRAGGDRADGNTARDTTAGMDAGDDTGYDGDRPPCTCVVCLEEQVDMVFTSCGHLCCCVRCGSGLDKCPICRIKSRAIKVYHP